MLQAIQTRYDGHLFRSRLEARWAVFFNTAGIKYEYEIEGYKIPKPEGGYWSYLPDFYLPGTKTWVEVKGDVSSVSDDYLEMIAHAVDFDGHLPDISDSANSPRGLLWLGEIPLARWSGPSPAHVIVQHGKGVWINACMIQDGFGPLSPPPSGECFDSYALNVDRFRKEIALRVSGFYYEETPCSRNVAKAYSAARSARFEHGETPR